MKTLEKNDSVVKLLKDMYSDLKAGLSIGVLFFFRQNVSIRADTW